MRIIASIALVLSFVALTAGGGKCDSSKAKNASYKEGMQKAAYKCDASAQTCINKIAQKTAERGWIGVELNGEGKYMKITAVVPGSPAAMAGLQAGDEILAIQGVSTAKESKMELEKTFASLRPGDEITTKVANADGKRKVSVTLASVPQDVAAKWMGKHMLAHAQVENVN